MAKTPTTPTESQPEWEGTCGPKCCNIPFDLLTMIGCPYCPPADDAPAT